MVPTVEFPPAIPLIFHTTAEFTVPVTEALSCNVLSGFRVAALGETVTVMERGEGAAVPPPPHERKNMSWSPDRITRRTFWNEPPMGVRCSLPRLANGARITHLIPHIAKVKLLRNYCPYQVPSGAVSFAMRVGLSVPGDWLQVRKALG
jgi:hypothetical protein